ncbi:COP1-interacting protein 7 [Cardamine amara subsp. amara]|uniref:COP1-interacting protein 7 n=1 Tax=Cardamine amara subsp. amara TaxID=228776 RepID=A0ABD1BRL6_CARAN
MRSDTVLNYAVFELSPKHSRCELFGSSNEHTEKLASGLIQPFVNHLRVLETQASPVAQSSIRLEVEENNTWFTKKTLERFVQYVNSSEALEKVNTYYSEMSQLEAARTLYSQRSEDSKFGASDDGAAADATKKELLRAIDLRLEAIKKDLTTSISHASASGFDPHTVSDLQQFADRFGAHHLGEACSKYISLWKKRPDLIDMKQSNHLAGVDNVTIEKDNMRQKQNAKNESEHQILQCATTSTKNNEQEKSDESVDVTSSTVQTSQLTRRLSVQDRINLFENKQKENSNSGGSKPVVVTKSTELRRLSSDITFSEKPVLRRSSIVSDMSTDLASEKKLESFTGGSSSTPSSVPCAIALTDSNESVKKGDEVKYELKNNSEKVVDEASRDSAKSSKTVTEKTLVSVVEATSDGQSRSVIGSNDSSTSQNQTDSYVDRLQNVMSDAKSRQREEVYEVKANNVPQSSSLFPSRHTRSRSAHIEAGFQEDLASQPQCRSSVGRIKKKEVAPSDEQPVLPQKPHVNIKDGLDDGEGRQVRTNSHRFPTASMDQIPRTRLSKENPGVNNELKMKANELEKLFAEHQLRVPGEQSSSSRRGKPSETQVAHTEPSHSTEAVGKRLYLGGGSGDLSKLITPLASDKDKGDALRRNFSDVSLMDDSKGKFYEKYMKKRDAKLREEWSLKKGEKETKLKSMQEALEQSRTEMKAKFAASASSERQDSLSSSRQRAEKFRSFNSRSSMKKYQHPINSFQSEEDEDFSEQKPRGKDKPASGQQSTGNIGSRSSQARKVQPNKNMSSSITPRIAASVPKPSGKVSNTSSGRRRSDKSLAQSVPNFSGLIKENTKPSSLAVKTTMRSQVRSSGRTKNTKEDTPLQRPRSLRKSSSGNIDFTEVSTLYSDDMMNSLRVDSDISENLRNEAYDEPEDEAEEVLENAVREEEEEEEEEVEEELEEALPMLSEEYEKVDNSREENCSFLPATVPPTLLSSLMDSPGESPLSWNSNLQHSFSYPHEHSSDVDASADSPMGSPASWSSRMRKKWGTAQSPVTVAAANNLSQFQSKKDLTKGFKRLLKFGRKSRGAESLMMDWVSVTTSEGDDEVEDRRELADRSSDDLRKSRMGSLQSHLSEDGFHENEFTEQASNISVQEDHQMSGSNFKAQKSFFSLSTFRGKGNETKPR